MASLPPVSLPIPHDLSTTLYLPKTPWQISPGLFDRIQKQQMTEPKAYKVTLLNSSDPEYAFIFKYFYYNKPSKYGIRSISCVHNAGQTQAFEIALQNMEGEAKKFPPTWHTEAPVAERVATIERWKACTTQFSPIENLSQRVQNISAKVLPLWHGTNAVKADSICSTGFQIFGKHDFINPTFASGAKQSTDIGYFGSGIYFTNSAHYASMYTSASSTGILLLAWVAMREPYPVVNDMPHPKKGSDMLKLQGNGAYKDYNAHYIPVKSIAPANPDCLVYYPCSKSEIPDCDEYVIFQKFHAVARFQIELGVELPRPVSENNAKADKASVVNAGYQQPNNPWATAAASPYGQQATYNSNMAYAAQMAALTANQTFGAANPAYGYQQYAYNPTMNPMVAQTAASAYGTAMPGFGYQPYQQPFSGPNTGMGFTPFAAQNSTAASAAYANSDARQEAYLQQVNEEMIKAKIIENQIQIDAYNRTLQSPAQPSGSTAQSFSPVVPQAVQIDEVDAQGRNELHRAANDGKVNAVATLVVEKKHLIETKDSKGRTPLMLAAYGGHEQICKILVDAGAIPNVANPEATTSDTEKVFGNAVEQGKSTIVRLLVTNPNNKFLLETGLMLGSKPAYPLVYSVKQNNREMVSALLDGFVNLNTGLRQLNAAALMNALELQRNGIVQEFVNRRLHLERVEDREFFPLMFAVQYLNFEACKILLKAGADPFCKSEGVDIYSFALSLSESINKEAYNAIKSTEIAKIIALLKSYREGNAATQNISANEQNEKTSSSTALEAPKTIPVDAYGRNELHLAVEEERGNAVSEIVASKKYLLETKDGKGRTPLMMAVFGKSRARFGTFAFKGNEQICKVLLNAGAIPNIADPTVTNKEIEQVFNDAMKNGKAEIVRLLVKANKYLLELVDGSGLTPFLRAAYEGQAAICEVLLDAGADFNYVCQGTFKGENSLSLAITYDKANVVQVFATRNLLLNSRCNEYPNPLFIAVKGKKYEACEILLKAGVDQYAKDKNGRDVLAFAEYELRYLHGEDIIRLLKKYRNDSCCTIL